MARGGEGRNVTGLPLVWRATYSKAAQTNPSVKRFIIANSASFVGTLGGKCSQWQLESWVCLTPCFFWNAYNTNTWRALFRPLNPYQASQRHCTRIFWGIVASKMKPLWGKILHSASAATAAGTSCLAVQPHSCSAPLPLLLKFPVPWHIWARLNRRPRTALSFVHCTAAL